MGSGWTHKGETSGKDCASLSIAAPELETNKHYANFGVAVRLEHEDLYAVIWGLAD